MTSTNMEGMIQRPEQEIDQKLNSYFSSNGFKNRGVYNGDSPDDGDYSYDVRGTLDDVRVLVSYYDFKPKKTVIRELMALDERISEVVCLRTLSTEKFREKACDLCDTTIYVMIDGVMQQTTWYEYVTYQARNIDYTKRSRL